jgi:hypothetical protein
MKNSTKIDIRIDWSEIDLFGHVNNLAIMKYVQAARVNMLEDLKLMQLQAEEKKGPILASIECQFLKPLFYPGQVTVYSNIGAIKNSSFQIHHSNGFSISPYQPPRYMLIGIFFILPLIIWEIRRIVLQLAMIRAIIPYWKYCNIIQS